MHGAPALGGQFEPSTAQRAAGGVLMGDQVAQFQPAVSQRAVQAGAQLAGGVIHQPLLGAAAVVGLGMQAAEHAGMARVLVDATAEGRGDLAVVQLAGDARLVDVAVQEFHQHLAAHAGQEAGAPVGAGHPFGHGHPAAAGVVAGGMAGLGAAGVGQAAGVGRAAALPAELDAHLVLAVGGHRRVGDADHARGLRAVQGGAVLRQGAQRHATAGGDEAVAVGTAFQCRAAQQVGDALVQVVQGHVLHRQQLEGLAFVLRMLGQAEGAAGGQPALAAAAAVEYLADAQRIQPRLRFGIGPAGLRETAGARLHIDLQRRQAASVGTGLRGHGTDLLAVPAGHGAGVGHQLLALGEGGDAIAGLGHVGAMEAQRAAVRQLGPRLEHHQRVRGLIALCLLDAPGQAGFGQQAGDEGPVGLAVLGGDRTDRQFGLHVEAEHRLRVVGEDLLADGAGVLVLEDHRIAAQPQQRRPGFKDQAVAGQAAIAAQLCRLGAQAMPLPQRAVGLAQLQGQRLLQPGFQFQEGVGSQAVDLQAVVAADRFGAFEAFDDPRFMQPLQAQQAWLPGVESDCPDQTPPAAASYAIPAGCITLAGPGSGCSRQDYGRRAVQSRRRDQPRLPANRASISSSDLPLVSGSHSAATRKNTKWPTVGRKIAAMVVDTNWLISSAMLMPLERMRLGISSDSASHTQTPGPTAKNATNTRMQAATAQPCAGGGTGPMRACSMRNGACAALAGSAPGF
ncbi:hypothetical protein G6F40_012236 [Rhizopus arrhizus]|nr:hypothetical protein G6F40_012236 [Rhizopus arrhizus]